MGFTNHSVIVLIVGVGWGRESVLSKKTCRTWKHQCDLVVSSTECALSFNRLCSYYTKKVTSA